MDIAMNMEELLALPVSVDLITAGRAFGLGRTRAFELARQDEFPCRVIRIGANRDGRGGKFRVPRSAIFEALGITDDIVGIPRPAA
jgi:hypothetical protein